MLVNVTDPAYAPVPVALSRVPAVKTQTARWDGASGAGQRRGRHRELQA